nr:retrotransposon protein, putative [Tanacetum cinerariifolium]
GGKGEVKLADGRVVSTNTVLKGFTMNLVNHIFEIDLMPIKLGTFHVIIGMNWLVKHDVVIVCGEKVVRIPYRNKTLIVESDKEKKSKEKRLEDVAIICDFPEVFPDDFPGLALSLQDEEEHRTHLKIILELLKKDRFAPILALPAGTEDFVVYYDASLKGYGAVLMQREKVIAYASRQLKVHEKNYASHDLELGPLFLLTCYGDIIFMGRNKALGTNLDMSNAYHPQTDGQSERTIQTLKDMLRAYVIDFGSSWDRHLPLVELSYNNSYHASIKAAPYEDLYGRKYRSLALCVFGKCGKLSPHCIGPFKILARVGPVAYTLELPKELKWTHSIFHVSNLKKCLAEGDIVVSMDEI